MNCTYAKADGSTCGALAISHYRWAWGDTGFACTEHVTSLQQLAVQLNRTIEWAPTDEAEETDVATLGTVHEPTAEDLQRAELVELRHELEQALLRIQELEQQNETLTTRNATAVETIDKLRTERDSLRMATRHHALDAGHQLIENIRSRISNGEPIVLHNFSFDPYELETMQLADTEAARLVLLERNKELERELKELRQSSETVVEGDTAAEAPPATPPATPAARTTARK